MTPELEIILKLLSDFVLSGIFAYMFITERRDHAETRKELYKDVENARGEHREDLRQLAGLRQSLQRQPYPPEVWNGTPPDKTRTPKAPTTGE